MEDNYLITNSTGAALIAEMTTVTQNFVYQLKDKVGFGRITANDNGAALHQIAKMLEAITALSTGQIPESFAKMLFLEAVQAVEAVLGPQ